MDDEEYEAVVSSVHVLLKTVLIQNCHYCVSFNAQNYGQPLNRVLVGNFEYRMFLRCRHAAKIRFIKLRSDVLVKLQLLDNKRGGEDKGCMDYEYILL